VYIKSDRAAAAALAILIAGGMAIAWLFCPQLQGATHYIVGFIGRRIETAITGQKLAISLIVIALMTMEVLLLGWRKSSVFRLLGARRYSALIDLAAYTILITGMTDVVVTIMTFGISVEFGRIVNWVTSQYGWTRITLPTDGLLQIAVGFSIFWLANSFFGYWGHRLMHTRFLWPLHRFHHAATELNFITSLRQHPLEPAVLTFLGLVAPMVFFNVSDQILLLYLVVGTTADLLGHSQLPWTYGWIGSWLIFSPRTHQVHHSAEEEHRDLHFASCPLWDHVFGTWYEGDKLPTMYGVPDNQYEERPLRQFGADALTFYASIGKSIHGGLRAFAGKKSRISSIGPEVCEVKMESREAAREHAA
jgi:sterol desaturase/sphingolipid hydroxylase (fatty acid hydroxylase superfamily)